MAVSYATDIKPLFTQIDQAHMRFVFDLWQYDDVKTNASEIYARLANKTMPPKPEGPWTDARIALFKNWMDGGCQP